MKNVLIVAATEMELDCVRGPIEASNIKIKAEFLATGVGMINTVYALTSHLKEQELPDTILNIGVAGSFKSHLKIGDVVQVTQDRFSEVGVEDHHLFVPAHEMGLLDEDEMVFSSSIELNSLRQVSGITVNKVHGNTASIEATTQLFNPDIESMEGAAVAFVAKKMNIPWIQLRAISNKVEARNRDAWDISLALENLKKEVVRVLEEL